MSAFEEIGLCPELITAIERMDWLLPTAVQAEAVGLILGGGDVSAAAETGSGKTGAFALPLLQICHEWLREQMAGRTNGGGAGGGGGGAAPPVAWLLSAEDRERDFAVGDDGLLCQSRNERQWFGARASHGLVGGGAYYYEATAQDAGLLRFGWSLQAGTLELGTDSKSFGFGSTGKKSSGGQFTAYGDGKGYGEGDTLGVMLDLGSGTISYTLNGKALGVAFDKLPKEGGAAGWFPAVCIKNGECELNFGAKPFRFGPPPAYVAVVAAGPDATVTGLAGGGKGGGGGGGGGGG
eukprot:SAG22_NODE_3308_length_1789_cov_1.218343_1_plen_293_part_10